MAMLKLPNSTPSHVGTAPNARSFILRNQPRPYTLPSAAIRGFAVDDLHRRRHILQTLSSSSSASASAADAGNEPSAVQLESSSTEPVASITYDSDSLSSATDADTDGTLSSYSVSSQDPEAPETEEQPKQKSSLAKRAIFGTILGLGGAVVILLGGWLYAAAACLVAFQCSKEFIGLVNAKGISKGMKPPSAIISSAMSLLCVAVNAWAFVSGGRTASAMAVSTFMVLSLQLIASHKPRFSQLTSAVFGLVYCGYLPSFWIKLRWLSVPAVHSTLMQSWQSGVSGVTQATVGVVATFMTVACIIAADTGAYFCGKSLGRTKLIRISPKKTVEGAIGGLVSSIAVALALFKLFAWPDNPVTAAALGTVIFFSSLFGDLIESVIKRDAGLKDASNLIPGHGGLLDRMDSYLFTGACVYFFIRYVMKGYGVL